jgi:hypothetical protein
MPSVNRHVLLVTYSVFLLGSLCSPMEVSMRSGQTVQSKEQATRTTIDRFNEAFNRHEADGLVAFLTEDTVFEDTSPAPDGRRIEGKAAVVEFWRGWFVRNPDCTVRNRGSVRQRKSGHSAVGVSQDAQRSAMVPAWC